MKQHVAALERLLSTVFAAQLSVPKWQCITCSEQAPREATGDDVALMLCMSLGMRCMNTHRWSRLLLSTAV